MSEDLHALADAAQAVYFRGHLQQEHADLAIELAHYTKTLTDYMVAGDMRPVSDLRRHIRTIERALQKIDRMVAALDDRFPDERS
jgi:hypothetical protein